MVVNFQISDAHAADTEAIASLFAISWTSPFARLQFGDMKPDQLSTFLEPRITVQMARENSRFIVVRSQEKGEVAAVAHWTIPVGAEVDLANDESEEDREERQQFENETYRRSLPESTNKDLVVAFASGLRKLREETLNGRPHYLLENKATHPKYRGKGLASRLVEWAFALADKEQVLVYLDTASDNPAARLYQRLGFEEQGRNIIKDLTRFAPAETIQQLECDTEHTHVAFLRFPKVREFC